MNTPTIYNADYLIRTGNESQREVSEGRWVASRPFGFYGLCIKHRLKCAWLVFTGKADVLTWTKQ